jgi:hypothetical protein
MHGRRPTTRLVSGVATLALSLLLTACTSLGVGFSLPFPGGSVGVGVDSSGRVGGGVSVGSGPVKVGVGGTAQLPPPAPSAPSAPASAADSAAGR